MNQQRLPNIWLRSFFGFSPENDGYIGWTKDANRQHVMGKITPGDLMMIYGAGSSSTSASERLRILGFLQIEPTPIRDTDKASAQGMRRKRDNGWDEKWTYALPVRRAWRVNTAARLDQIAFKTYQPEKGQAIAAWSPGLEQVEIERAMALHVTEVPVYGEPPVEDGLVDRPLSEAFSGTDTDPLLPADFESSFGHFQDLLECFSGEAFTRFDEGLIAAWESYKPRLREVALERLTPGAWEEHRIGSGEILDRTIDAIEIQATHGDLTNNLVFWQNRFGHANREHRALLEAQATGTGIEHIERLLFQLFRSDRDEGEVFQELSEATGAKYPLLAYLFFLKDIDRFMPIQPTGFDRVFEEMGVQLRTLRNCSWENYVAFNSALVGLKEPIKSSTGLSNVRLVDTHSLLWVFSTLLKKEAQGALTGGAKASERVLGARERSIADIKYSVGRTVFKSNGQTVERKVKEKELRMNEYELDKVIRNLLELQEDRCAISGLPFQFRGAHDDENMLPSLDRIDSSGHYEKGNLQMVCRFINFWKQASNDSDFRRLLNIVRGIEDANT